MVVEREWVEESGGGKELGERERRGRRENSECFIVEAHLTHYKRYDYKHTHTDLLYKTANKQRQTHKTKPNKNKN